MKTLNFILFLFAASVLAAGTDFPSDKYSIAPGPPNVTTELKLINGATMSVPGGKTCTRMSFKTQRLTTITINSRHDRKKLVRGIMTVKDTSKNISVPCHILFILQAKSGDKRWEPIPFTNTNENKKAFGVDYTSNVIGIGEPAPGSNSQQASLYQTLNKDVVYLVDHNPDNSNMLFRGNLPFTKGKTETSKDQRLDLKSLSQIFDKIISRFGLNSQEKYNFIVVPLISDKGDSGQLKQEYALFNNNESALPPSQVLCNPLLQNLPDKMKQAQMLWWEIEPGKTKYYTQNISELAANLKKIMNSKNKIKFPTFIYIHCINGHDRTAIAATSYLFQKYNKISNMTIDHAFVYGTTVFSLDPQIYSAQQFGNTVKDFKTKDTISGISRILPINDYYVESIEAANEEDISSTYRQAINNAAYGFTGKPWEYEQEGEI